MAAASGAVAYQGRILTVKEFLENELRIGIERWDRSGGYDEFGSEEWDKTHTHYEPGPESAAVYLFRELKIDKEVPEKKRPKYQMVYADKYGNRIW